MVCGFLVIWDLGVYVYCGFRTARGKVWGSDEVNVEGWKPLKRLPGHESGTPSPLSLLPLPSPSSSLSPSYPPPPKLLTHRLKPTDVTDLAWSPGDRYLASCGLDSQVIIWCGFTLGECSRVFGIVFGILFGGCVWGLRIVG